MQPEMERDPVRPPLPGAPQRDDPSLRVSRQPARARVRSRTAISHRRPGQIPVDPPLRCRRRALEPFRSSTDRPTIPKYQQRQPAASFRRQRGISVSHGDLRLSQCVCGNPHPRRRSLLCHPFTTSQGSTSSSAPCRCSAAVQSAAIQSRLRSTALAQIARCWVRRSSSHSGCHVRPARVRARSVARSGHRRTPSPAA